MSQMFPCGLPGKVEKEMKRSSWSLGDQRGSGLTGSRVSCSGAEQGNELHKELPGSATPAVNATDQPWVKSPELLEPGSG